MSKKQNIIIFQDYTKEIEKRGEWDDHRRLSAINAMIRYRPFQQETSNIQLAWTKVLEETNSVSPELKPVAISTIQTYIKRVRKKAKENYKKSKTTTKIPHTLSDIDSRGLELYELMDKGEEGEVKEEFIIVDERSETQQEDRPPIHLSKPPQHPHHQPSPPDHYPSKRQRLMTDDLTETLREMKDMISSMTRAVIESHQSIQRMTEETHRSIQAVLSSQHQLNDQLSFYLRESYRPRFPTTEPYHPPTYHEPPRKISETRHEPSEQTKQFKFVKPSS